MTPAGEDLFSRWRDSTGVFWREAGLFVSFTTANGRATGFEVQSQDGTAISRATRLP